MEKQYKILDSIYHIDDAGYKDFHQLVSFEKKEDENYIYKIKKCRLCGYIHTEKIKKLTPEEEKRLEKRWAELDRKIFKLLMAKHSLVNSKDKIRKMIHFIKWKTVCISVKIDKFQTQDYRIYFDENLNFIKAQKIIPKMKPNRICENLFGDYIYEYYDYKEIPVEDVINFSEFNNNKNVILIKNLKARFGNIDNITKHYEKIIEKLGKKIVYLEDKIEDIDKEREGIKKILLPWWEAKDE